MRWFGPLDPVSLSDIRQAGCRGVVTALHQIPVGDVWSKEAITERNRLIVAENHRYNNLQWEVVESLPVHEDLKKGKPGWNRLIDSYSESLKNLAWCGIRTVCYNFMPVLDWSRTDVSFERPDGSRTLRYVASDFALFDLYVLKRLDAEEDYDYATRDAAYRKWKSATSHELNRLTDTVLLGLPGSGEKYELPEFKKMLDQYRELGEKGLRENLYRFVKEVGSAAAEFGINLCIHPDDPPRPLLGLPRIVSKATDLRQIFDANPIKNNGLTFCTGSLGVAPENQLEQIVEEFGDRIHFIHLRSTVREENPSDFHEAAHLFGDVDMYAVIKAIKLEEQKRRKATDDPYEIPMRPDHGFQMLDDLKKTTYPGYSAIGRLKGLAELRGLEHAITHELEIIS
jgi:mannonate dehydratase